MYIETNSVHKFQFLDSGLPLLLAQCRNEIELQLPNSLSQPHSSPSVSDFPADALPHLLTLSTYHSRHP